MMTEVSLTEAKNRLSALLRAAKEGEPIRITRRGQTVGVLLSEAEYERLTRALQQARPSLTEAIASYREQVSLDWDLTPEEVEAWRDGSSGRGTPWPD